MNLPILSESTPTRREFCTKACRAVSVLATAGLAACGVGPTAPTLEELSSVDGSVSGRTISVTIAGSSLASVGAAALVMSSLGPFLVAQPSQDAFVALTAICTHQGCTVTGFSGDQFVCPCHGSRFTTNGTVAAGPAASSLQQYPTHFDGAVLTFDV
jgi:cytochrome b6-f complex iron-sulfur subunit